MDYRYVLFGFTAQSCYQVGAFYFKGKQKVQDMKIAIVGTAYPYRGGIANFNERLAIQLIADGHEVRIFTFKLLYPNFLFPGKTQYSTDFAPAVPTKRLVNSINPFNWIKAALQMRRGSYDLVVFAYWLPFIAPCFGSISRIIGKKTPKASIIHNLIPHEHFFANKFLAKFFIKACDVHLCLSKSVLDDLRAYQATAKGMYSPHPIYDTFGERTEREEALLKLSLDAEYRYLLFFGLIRDYKGLDILIKALSNSRLKAMKIKLIIAGEYYSDRERYQNLIKENELEDRIIQTDGFVPKDKVADYFNVCDVVVQPYKTATQSGVTQIAYHFNKPMIVTNVGGLPEMCPDGKVGYVCSADADAIANAICNFFESDKAAEFANNIELEKNKYSWKTFADKLLKPDANLNEISR